MYPFGFRLEKFIQGDKLWFLQEMGTLVKVNVDVDVDAGISEKGTQRQTAYFFFHFTNDISIEETR